MAGRVRRGLRHGKASVQPHIACRVENRCGTVRFGGLWLDMRCGGQKRIWRDPQDF